MKFRLIETLLTEGKNIDKTWEQYKDRIAKKAGVDITDPKEDEGLKYNWINSILRLDPTYPREVLHSTTTGDYGVWITNRYLNGEIYGNGRYVGTDVTNILNQFIEKKTQIKNKDINSYKTIDELVQTINSAQLSDRQIERQRRNAYKDSKFIYEDSSWYIFQVTTYESACTLGKGTHWCTAYSNDDSYYRRYIGDGNLYVIISKEDPEEKYQLFVPNDTSERIQFLDKDDANMHGNAHQNINVTEFLSMPNITDGLKDKLEELGIRHKYEFKEEPVPEPEDIGDLNNPIPETDESPAVAAVMYAEGCGAEKAIEKLDNEEVYVIYGVNTVAGLGQHYYNYMFDAESIYDMQAFLFERIGSRMYNQQGAVWLDNAFEENDGWAEDASYEDIGKRYVEYTWNKHHNLDYILASEIDYWEIGEKLDDSYITPYGTVEWQ